ncbi:MAG: 2-amino-4-hydroxy-6-hydroxymethyldihydropteridine diphosphokinase [Chromatiales bacterium]|nr:2-amino-4-hydroxy-6-hydroxymethyldihydropteridine diphosphokinase [Chromatiales bacterium]
MARIYLSIGSNIEREKNIRGGVEDLKRHFGEVTLSRVYESESVGFDGDNFYNLVAAIDTDMSAKSVSDTLHAIEAEHGRTREGPRFSSRTLDIDLLTYDDLVTNDNGLQLPRDEITKNAFVLWPLAEIAPQEKHPVLNQTYDEMWEEFDKERQSLWPVEFQW